MESKEETEAKLATYKGQLDQVNELLVLEPENEQFIKLKEDLTNVISLTNELLQQVKLSENTLDQPPIAITENSSDSGYKVGDIVEVTGGDRLFAGVITDIIGKEYKIKYYEYDTEVSLPVDNLKPIEEGTFSVNDIYPGMKCICKYATDQNWYEAEIHSITNYGCMVTYVQYGNSEEVPIQYLKPFDDEAVANISKKQKKEKDQKKDGLIPIPESLKIVPTDTEEEKLRKKKKIKAIKNKNRLITQEQEVAAVKNNWQKFVQKGTKRSLSGLNKSGSLFASSDLIGGKIGVINSGKGMTDFTGRKKHKFESS